MFKCRKPPSQACVHHAHWITYLTIFLSAYFMASRALYGTYNFLRPEICKMARGVKLRMMLFMKV
uniref:Uncharacterized protein n=1 Tax=Arundo donax TaxID=35708 RepID=A0A0A9AFU5_ARUDO